VNINLFLASEIQRLKNKIKDMINSNNKWLKTYNKLKGQSPRTYNKWWRY
jgi:hypothetical protein